MLRQVVLVIVVAVHLCTGTLLPMELFEIAHTHPAAHSKAVSLHDLLLTEGQFPQRNHPVVTFATDSAPSPRRHRKSANGMRRRNRGQHRRGRQLDREAGSVQPKIFYAVGATSEADLPICGRNAVCSKVDVYDADAPFIERQCICPQATAAAAPVVYQYNLDNRPASLQNHLKNVQRNRPQRILDLNYNNVRVPGVEEAYIKELMMKLRSSSNYDEVPEIILDERFALDVHGGRHLRKRPRPSAGNWNLNNEIHEKTFGKGKKRHNRRMNVPKIGGCSAMVGSNDGYTIVDKTRHYKVCDLVDQLPECEYLEHTWSMRMTTAQTNVTEQIVYCRCKKNSVTYLKDRKPLENGFEFFFACAPPNDLRCQRKEPCKLFSVRDRKEVQEVNTHPLCKCPREHYCPTHHTEPEVIHSDVYEGDHVRTYTAYCMADHGTSSSASFTAAVTSSTLRPPLQ